MILKFSQIVPYAIIATIDSSKNFHAGGHTEALSELDFPLRCLDEVGVECRINTYVSSQTEKLGAHLSAPLERETVCWMNLGWNIESIHQLHVARKKGFG